MTVHKKRPGWLAYIGDLKNCPCLLLNTYERIYTIDEIETYQLIVKASTKFILKQFLPSFLANSFLNVARIGLEVSNAKTILKSAFCHQRSVMEFPNVRTDLTRALNCAKSIFHQPQQSIAPDLTLQTASAFGTWPMSVMVFMSVQMVKTKKTVQTIPRPQSLPQ